MSVKLTRYTNIPPIFKQNIVTASQQNCLYESPDLKSDKSLKAAEELFHNITKTQKCETEFHFQGIAQIIVWFKEQSQNNRLLCLNVIKTTSKFEPPVNNTSLLKEALDASLKQIF